MNEVEISDACIDQCFEWRKPHALDDPRCHHALVILPRRAAPSATNDDEAGTKKVQMSFPPYSSRGDKDEACDSDAQEMVTSQKSDLREVDAQTCWRRIVPEGEGEGVRGE